METLVRSYQNRIRRERRLKKVAVLKEIKRRKSDDKFAQWFAALPVFLIWLYLCTEGVPLLLQTKIWPIVIWSVIIYFVGLGILNFFGKKVAK